MSLTLINLPLTVEPEVDFDRELEWFRHEYMSTPDPEKSGQDDAEDDTEDDTEEQDERTQRPETRPAYEDFGQRFLGC